VYRVIWKHGLPTDQEGPMSRGRNLPSKTCPRCGRPFTWRKKWQRDWANVIYCSDRCRRRQPLATSGEAR